MHGSILLFLWTITYTCLYCSFCGLSTHARTTLSVDYNIHIFVILLLWTTHTRLCRSFCGLWNAHVYTALSVDCDIHMSAILFLWTTYTFILLFLWTMICICLYCSFLWTMVYICLQFCGLHTHVYTTLAVDYIYMSIMLFLWIIRLLRPHAVDTMFKSQELTYFLWSMHIFIPPQTLHSLRCNMMSWNAWSWWTFDQVYNPVIIVGLIVGRLADCYRHYIGLYYSFCGL